MSSTEFTIGLNEGSRISSKVLKPPGGGSSDIFGVGTSYSRNKLCSEEITKTSDSASHIIVSGSNSSCQSSVIASNGLENGYDGPPARNKKTLIRRNPITGEEVEIDITSERKDKHCDKDDSESKDKHCDKGPFSISSVPVQTSIRIRNPPGGKSSGIF